MRVGFSCLAALCGLWLATATPAAATNLDQVRSMCAKNPKCTPLPSPPGDKGGDFCIDTKPGGGTCDALVWCPGDRSACGVIEIVAGERKPVPNLSADTLLQATPN